jgi:HTH-type transcriptional regulator / antitoxin HigA
MKTMQYKINSEEEYQQVMERVQSYLQKSTVQGGGHTLTSAEKADLQYLSLLAETWEDGIPIMPIRQPRTLTEMLELKMYERKMKQKDLAIILGITATRLSEVMQGKRKVNMDLAKRLYKLLNIDPAFILEHA